MIPKVGEHYSLGKYESPYACRIRQVTEDYIYVDLFFLDRTIALDNRIPVEGFKRLKPELLNPLEVLVYDL